MGPSIAFLLSLGMNWKKLSCYFSIKWLIPFYPALCAQAASGVEKCMNYVFRGDAADRLLFIQVGKGGQRDVPPYFVILPFFQPHLVFRHFFRPQCAMLWASWRGADE